MSGRRSEPGTYQSADLTDPVFALCPVRAPLVSVEGYTLHAIHLLPQLGVLDGKTIAANNRSDADEVLPRRHVYPAIYHPPMPRYLSPQAHGESGADPREVHGTQTWQQEHAELVHLVSKWSGGKNSKK